MRTRRWLFILLPSFIGLALSLLLNLTDLKNPIIYLRADLGTLMFLSGLLISGALTLIIYINQRFRSIEETTAEGAAQDRRRFIQLLDHELKNPLTAILAGIANLSNGEGEAQRESSLDSIRAQVQRLSRLVSDLRKLSDLETRPLEYSQVNLSEVLREIFEMGKSSQTASDRQFNLLLPRAPWPLPEIHGDSDLLFLAIHNLMDNAIKYSQPGDAIELRAREDGNNLVIEVADTGVGIPDDEIELVWTELFRGKAARSLPGSGLGLSLSKAIVKRHHGEVSIRSRSGQGTVVTVRLPLGM